MTVSEIMVKMVKYSKGNLHDINHFMKVYAYAKTIAECEQRIIEIAAIIHDIACPLCREKYGNTNGKLQEKEGAVLAEEFLKGTGLSNEMVNRIIFLVAHHHTFQEVDGIDYQILLEADYLVNADESGYQEANIRNVIDCVFKTSSGKMLLQSVYGIAEGNR